MMFIDIWKASTAYRYRSLIKHCEQVSDMSCKHFSDLFQTHSSDWILLVWQCVSSS